MPTRNFYINSDGKAYIRFVDGNAIVSPSRYRWEEADMVDITVDSLNECAAAFSADYSDVIETMSKWQDSFVQWSKNNPYIENAEQMDASSVSFEEVMGFNAQ